MTFATPPGPSGAIAADRDGADGHSALETSPATVDSKRHAQRIAAPRLKVSVVKKTLFGAREIAFCDLLDLSRGGVCLASPWLKAKLDQKLDMEFYHAHQTFHARGVVTRRPRMTRCRGDSTRHRARHARTYRRVLRP